MEAIASPEISSEFPFEMRHVKVLGAQMAFVDVGVPNAQTLVFLHGNPTSSYLWRNIIPYAAKKARCIAPDLIGMGQSEKVPSLEYRFADHANYLAAFLDTVVPNGKIVLVVHDWGSALGFDWARTHENRVAGLAFMEFIRPIPSWDIFHEGSRDLFQSFRNPESGRKLVIDQNLFIEGVLRQGVIRPLGDAEMDHYRAPFLQPETREPMWRWPNEIPVGGTPTDVHEIAQSFYDWLLNNDLPKLFFWATPGALISESLAATLSNTLRNTRSVGIGPGVHYVQEDNPHLIGREIVDWISVIH